MRHNLSEINNIIKDRRTIYPEQYSSRKVHKEIIEKLIYNATWAPNHGMTQPWRFTVFMDEGRKKLSEFLGSFYKENVPKKEQKPLKHERMINRPLKASAIIAVGMKRDPKEKIREIEEIEAVACAIQNIYLTATTYGIGAFWSSPRMIYYPAINSFFDLGEKDKLLGLIYLGYPENEWPRGQRKPIDQMTNWVD